MTINISIPSDNKELARHIGGALANYGRGAAAPISEPIPEPVAAVTTGECAGPAPTAEPVAEVPAAIWPAILEYPGDVQVTITPDMTIYQSQYDALSPEQQAEHVGAIQPDPEPEAEAQSRDVDMNGVAKDAQFCADAKDPFYASGKRSGQWKKRKGVTEEQYDAWYAEQLAGIKDAVTEQPAAETSTAAAFGAATPETTPPAETITEAGQLMKWCAEMQTAGHFNQTAIDQAYAALGLTLPDIFPPAPNCAENVAKLYQQLSMNVPS